MPSKKQCPIEDVILAALLQVINNKALQDPSVVESQSHYDDYKDEVNKQLITDSEGESGSDDAQAYQLKHHLNAGLVRLLSLCLLNDPAAIKELIDILLHDDQHRYGLIKTLAKAMKNYEGARLVLVAVLDKAPEFTRRYVSDLIFQVDKDYEMTLNPAKRPQLRPTPFRDPWEK